MTVPSAATRSPGRMSSLSPTSMRSTVIPVACRRRADAAYRLGTQTHQAAYGRRGVALGALLHAAPEEYEGDDYGRRFEVEVRLDATFCPELREEQVEEAECVCYARAACHKRVHVGRAVAELAPCPREEAAPEDEDHGRGQQP